MGSSNALTKVIPASEAAIAVFQFFAAAWDIPEVLEVNVFCSLDT